MQKARLIKREDYLAQQQRESEPKPVTVQQFRAQLILARRDNILQSQECNANAKQKFAALFVKGEGR